MAITDETIEYVAALAKLDLTDEEKERAKKDLGNIIGYVDTMNQLDTTGIEPMSHVFAYHNVFREDLVTNGPDRKLLPLQELSTTWKNMVPWNIPSSWLPWPATHLLFSTSHHTQVQHWQNTLCTKVRMP